jgi:hypothetical protein
MRAGGVNGVGFAVMSFAPAQRRDGEIVSISFVIKGRRAPTSMSTTLQPMAASARRFPCTLNPAGIENLDIGASNGRA